MKLKVTLKKSKISGSKKTRLNLKALGLNKIGQIKIYPNNPQVKGMLRFVKHLVEIEQIGEENETS